MFVRTMQFGLLAIVVLVEAVSAASRPNFGFVFSDDHATQAISAYGAPC